MKRVIISIFVFSLSFFVFASEVEDLLTAAQESYKSGDLNAALKNINSAQKIIEQENISLTSNDYIELKNWDIVKRDILKLYENDFMKFYFTFQSYLKFLSAIYPRNFHSIFFFIICR